MKILFLGDVVGISGCSKVLNNLRSEVEKRKIDFVIVNGENSADDGHGIPKDIANELFTLGVDVITSGNHIWDKAETITYIDKENRLLRPANLVKGSPGKGFGVFLVNFPSLEPNPPASNRASGIVSIVFLIIILCKVLLLFIIGKKAGSLSTTFIFLGALSILSQTMPTSVFLPNGTFTKSPIFNVFLLLQ